MAVDISPTIRVSDSISQQHSVPPKPTLGLSITRFDYQLWPVSYALHHFYQASA